MRSHRRDERPQDLVPRRVPNPVVDALQVVDVDEGDDVATVAAPRPVELVCERQPADLAAERSGEIVEMRTVQLGLQSLALASGLGPVDRGLGAIRGGTNPVGLGASTNSPQLFGEWPIRFRDGAVDCLGASVPNPCGLVARGCGCVAIGGRLSPETGGPRSTDMGRKPMDLGRLALAARDLIGVQRRFPSVGGQLPIGARLVLRRRLLIARGVGVVSLRRRLVGV